MGALATAAYVGRHAKPRDFGGGVTADHVESLQIASFAGRLAGRLTEALQGPLTSDLAGQLFTAGSDLVEWCRDARDVLEEVSRG